MVFRMGNTGIFIIMRISSFRTTEVVLEITGPVDITRFVNALSNGKFRSSFTLNRLLRVSIVFQLMSVMRPI